MQYVLQQKDFGSGLGTKDAAKQLQFPALELFGPNLHPIVSLGLGHPFNVEQLQLLGVLAEMARNQVHPASMEFRDFLQE